MKIASEYFYKHDTDKLLEELQAELLKLASTKADYEDVADEIYRLREQKQNLQLENVGRDELKKRIADMSAFLRKHHHHRRIR